MTDLLETLRALAPVVTPGEWLRIDTENYARIEVAGCRWAEAVAMVAKPDDADLIALLGSNVPTIIVALETVAMIRDEDWLASQIPASSRSDAYHYARAIIAGLEKETAHDHD